MECLDDDEAIVDEQRTRGEYEKKTEESEEIHCGISERRRRQVW